MATKTCEHCNEATPADEIVRLDNWNSAHNGKLLCGPCHDDFSDDEIEEDDCDDDEGDY